MRPGKAGPRAVEVTMPSNWWRVFGTGERSQIDHRASSCIPEYRCATATGSPGRVAFARRPTYHALITGRSATPAAVAATGATWAPACGQATSRSTVRVLQAPPYRHTRDARPRRGGA